MLGLRLMTLNNTPNQRDVCAPWVPALSPFNFNYYWNDVSSGHVVHLLTLFLTQSIILLTMLLLVHIVRTSIVLGPFIAPHISNNINCSWYFHNTAYNNLTCSWYFLYRILITINLFLVLSVPHIIINNNIKLFLVLSICTAH